MVDAAGAIYVLGGRGGSTTDYNDVWASTDGGARPDSVKVVGRRGVHWVGTTVLRVLQGELRGTKGVLQGY